MRKVSSQTTVALVCCILGFMLAYQFKVLNKYEKNVNSPKNGPDVTVEIEQYKKQKDDLEKKINELQTKVSNYEKAAASQDDTAKEIVKELEDTRMLVGSTDVHGPGVTVYITPKSTVLRSNIDSQPIIDKDILDIVNELNAAGAEAVAVNDYRITSRTGIRNGGNFIYVNEEKISPWKRVVIQAIGDKSILDASLNFPGALPELKDCDVKIERSDDIKIAKYNSKTLKFQFAKPVK